MARRHWVLGITVAVGLLLLLPAGAAPARALSPPPAAVAPAAPTPTVAAANAEPAPAADPGPPAPATPAFDLRLPSTASVSVPMRAEASLQRVGAAPNSSVPARTASGFRASGRPLGDDSDSSLQTLYSLNLANGSLAGGEATTSQQPGAEFTAYDPLTALLYVSDGGYEVKIVDPGRFVQVGSFNATVPAGALTYDPIDGDLLVESAGVVAAIDPATLAPDYTLAVPAASATDDGTMVLDEVQNTLWVTNPYSANVSVVNLTSRTVVAERHVGIGFNDILSGVYDPQNGRVYLDYYENGTVEVFNASSMARLGNVNLSEFCCFAWGLGIDPVTGTVYVTVGLYGWGSYLVAISNRTDVATASLSIGGFPSGVVYDPTTGDLYVADAAKSRITVVDPTNLSIVERLLLPQEASPIAGQLYPVDLAALGTIDIATGFGETLDAISTTNSSADRVIDFYVAPRAMAYDTACGCEVVTDAWRDLVEFVDPATMSVAWTQNLSGEPYGIAYDPVTAELWVTIGGLFSAGAVEILNGTTGAPIVTLPDNESPWGIAFDPGANQMFVANFFGSNVSVFNASNRSLSAKIPVGDAPEGIAFDPTTDAVYVAVFLADDLTEIDAGTDAVVGSISVPNDPTLVAIDNDTGTVYVAESSGNITAITAANLTDVGPIPVSYVTGFAWDPSAGGVLAFNETGSVALLNGSSLGATDFAVGVATASGGWAPGAGLLVADAATGDLLLVGTPGLELATNFTLRVAPEIGGVGDEFTVSWTFSGNLEPTGFGWGASGNVSFSASSSSPDGPLDVELTGAGVLSLHVSVEFANGQVLSGQLTFAAVPSTLVSFDESGLGPDGAWYVAIAEGPYVTGAPGTIDLPLANGVYAFQVGTFSAGYLVAPAFGVVRVNGTAVSIVEEFEPVFLVTATASGLAAGTNWSLVVGGVVHSSTSPAITFLAGNGSYAYRLGLVSGYAAANGSGTFGVAGEPVELSFAFHRVTYLVTFSESGLIPGTVWWLYAGWLSDPYWSTANASVAFSLPNGTYDYFFYSAAGYRLTQSNALLVVDGSAVNVSATYTPYPDSIFSVAFDESGLPNGSTWSVDFAGRSATSNGSEISFLSFNGTWSYAIGNVAGHVASPASGTVTVNGAAANVSVIYAPTLYSITFAEFGRPLDRPWTVSLAGALQFTGNDQVTFQVPNGSYPFRVTGPPGYRAEGVGGVGTITVDGASQLLAVDFVRAPTAEISFTRAGLAPHSVWCVAMVDVSTCATTSAIHFPGLTPGDYAYAVLSPTAGQTVTAHLGAEAVATSGTIDLGARSVTVAFKFAYQYFVTFAASGLPAGTDWSVRFEGTLRATNGSAIVFLASNGSSSFRLFAPAGYRAVATPGRVRVEGSAVVVNVAFHPIGHPATPESSTSAPVRAPEMRRAPDVALTRWRS